MRDQKSGKKGEGPLRAAGINFLPEKLEIANISSKAVSLLEKNAALINNLANYRSFKILCKKALEH